jgi:hypothetical protein
MMLVISGSKTGNFTGWRKCGFSLVELASLSPGNRHLHSLSSPPRGLNNVGLCGGVVRVVSVKR